jgi:hypothetical protein
VNAPDLLENLVVAILLLLAGFFVWRMLVASGWRRHTDYPRDALYALTALGVAATQVTWLGSLPRPAWAGLFALAAVFFATRLVLARRDGAGWDLVRGHLLDAGIAAALVFMFTAGVAPSVLSGSTAGLVVMAGMADMTRDTTESYPALGLLLVLALVAGAVVLLDRFSATRPTAPASGSAWVDPLDRPGPVPLLAPRALELCRMVLLLVMAYAILGKLV